jgi:hypothetical protein
MYFKHPNGSFIRVGQHPPLNGRIGRESIPPSQVPQVANHNTGPGYQNGGMTVYYFQPRAPTKNLDIVAFRKVKYPSSVPEVALREY